jgi:hypothetical protein
VTALVGPVVGSVPKYNSTMAEAMTSRQQRVPMQLIQWTKEQKMMGMQSLLGSRHLIPDRPICMYLVSPVYSDSYV